MAQTSEHPTLGTRPALLAQFDRPLFLLAIAAGAAWTIGVMLVATQAVSDPVGTRYDAANRFLTLSLVLLLSYAVGLRTSPPGGSRRGALMLVVGSVLMLVGNVLEFWAVLLSGNHTEKTAVRLGESAVFWGSPVGWFIFLPGLLITVAAAAMLGRAVGGARGAILAALALTGLAATALWAMSSLLAGAAGLGLAVWLVGILQPRRSSSGTNGQTR